MRISRGATGRKVIGGGLKPRPARIAIKAKKADREVRPTGTARYILITGCNRVPK